MDAVSLSKVMRRVDDWKLKLIDLSRRNRLVHFRPTRSSTVRFEKPGIKTLFALTDPELLDVRIESCRVVILRRKIKMASTSLGQLTAKRGCFVSRVQRMGMDIPLEGNFVVQAADVVHLTGPASRLDEVAKLVGHIEHATNQTALVTFALGITVGLLVGTWTVTVCTLAPGLSLTQSLMTPSVASAAARIRPNWMRGSMSLSLWPLIVSMIWPALSLPVAAAGDACSMLWIFITKAGWTRSIPMPTGPKRWMVCSDFVSLGRVENSAAPL